MRVQVGNFTLERATWQRPEEMHTRRPVYYVATKNGAPWPALPGSHVCQVPAAAAVACRALVPWRADLCLRVVYQGTCD